MQKIVIDKHYHFVPPYKGTLWANMSQVFLPSYLRRTYGIESAEFRGVEHFRESLAAGHGIVLTPNHCRPCDPTVMGLLSRGVGQPFYYMASWHLSMQGRLQAWLIRRLGAFSVYREGVDREAIRAATDILTEGVRPLVLFPEGVISRTNDVLRPFMEGISLIAHAAGKERAKLNRPGRVVIHPVAIKYVLLTDVEVSLRQVLGEIESRFCWQQQELPIVERIVKIGEALLALKEIEYLGWVKNGAIPIRLQGLIDHLLDRLETKWLGGRQQTTFLGRVKALRAAILKGMINGELAAEELESRWRDLADIYLAVQLSSYPPNYVRSKPTRERLTETVERFEEDTTDNARIHGHWRVILKVGEAIEVGSAREGREEGLTGRLQETVQAMLDGLNREREVAT
ncbi:MAG: lysophospholipid acyltransferase family protein [Candidatus Binatia bacterium]